MAKGQLRGNKEAKKPKQVKKPAAPGGGLAGAVSRLGARTSEPKKS
jgi:hypothetical protein